MDMLSVIVKDPSFSVALATVFAFILIAFIARKPLASFLTEEQERIAEQFESSEILLAQAREKLQEAMHERDNHTVKRAEMLALAQAEALAFKKLIEERCSTFAISHEQAFVQQLNVLEERLYKRIEENLLEAAFRGVRDKVSQLSTRQAFSFLRNGLLSSWNDTPMRDHH